MVRDGQVSRHIRVLIADDDARVRIALRTFLVAHPGFEVVGEAGSVARALELARELLPCVALVDVLMPKVDDGLGLLRTLTAELGIPVVAMSLRGTLAECALAAGAAEFLVKDGSSDRLLAAVRNASRAER